MRLIVIWLFSCFCMTIHGQTFTDTLQKSYNNHIKKNFIYLSLGGRGLQNGLNYERIFIKKKAFLLSAGAGIDSPFLLANDVNYVITAPVFVNAYFFKGKHKLITGFGVTSLFQQYKERGLGQGIYYEPQHNEVIVGEIPSIGYAYLGRKGFLFRVEYLLLRWNYNKRSHLYSYGQLTFGHNF